MKKQNETKAKRVFNLIIVDESGSMSVIRKQAFSGMNETLETVRQMAKGEKDLGYLRRRYNKGTEKKPDWR